MKQKKSQNKSGTPSELSNGVLEIVQKLAQDVNPGLRRTRNVTLGSNLDRDIGLDSLARAELIFRLDKAFGTKLPDHVLVEADTPLDLVLALEGSQSQMETNPTITQSLYIGLERVDEPVMADTLVNALRFHVEQHAERPHVKVWLSEKKTEDITYGDLHREALMIAYGLIGLGVSPGDRVAIMLPTSAEFFRAFFGVLYAGAVPVPIYPPFRPSQVEDHLRRQAGILTNAETKILIISEEFRAVGSLIIGLAQELRHIVTVADISTDGILAEPVPVEAHAVSLIQYTSGSTGDPKGVVLTHANLLANIRSMGEALEASSSDVFVSWLPLYHDMGLIGAWLGSLYYGAHAIIMPPLAFLADPSRWLRLIHEHRATLSAAPNFAFELCCKNVHKEQIKGLDLSSLKLIVNGAEPVSAQTIDRFSETFAPYGFRPQMIGPVYGLAENSVGLAFPPLGRAPPVDRVKRDLLSKEGRAIPAEPNDQTALTFVACGQVISRHEIRVIDGSGRELPDRFEGGIQFRGPSATSGYFRNEQKTRQLIRDGWLDTGDRGYMHKGDVYVTGRVKDMIIKAGQNIYPQEIEELVGEIDGVRKGCAAAIASPDPKTGTEQLILVVETRIEREKERQVLRGKIGEACSVKLNTTPDIIQLVPPRSVPKTSSGKVRRSTTRELYESGLLNQSNRGLWFQLFRLWTAGFTTRIARAKTRLAALAFAAYWWGALILLAIAAWAVVMLLPVRGWRHAMIHYTSRLFLWLTAATPEVKAEADIPKDGCIFIVNHSSYLDSLVLTAVLKGKLAFVAKDELARQWIAGPFLRRLGTIFVRRTDVAGSIEGADTFMNAAQSGERIVTFPEGTLTRMPGLLPFKAGAFTTAAKSGNTVIPIALGGTRTILRGEQWFPRRGQTKVWLGSPLYANGSDFDAAIELRDRAREFMLANIREPDLGGEHITIGGMKEKAS